MDANSQLFDFVMSIFIITTPYTRNEQALCWKVDYSKIGGGEVQVRFHSYIVWYRGEGSGSESSLPNILNSQTGFFLLSGGFGWRKKTYFLIGGGGEAGRREERNFPVASVGSRATRHATRVSAGFPFCVCHPMYINLSNIHRKHWQIWFDQTRFEVALQTRFNVTELAYFL